MYEMQSTISHDEYLHWRALAQVRAARASLEAKKYEKL